VFGCGEWQEGFVFGSIIIGSLRSITLTKQTMISGKLRFQVSCHADVDVVNVDVKEEATSGL
jgi:hypothetical protein